MSTFYLTAGERPMVYFVSSTTKRKDRREMRRHAKAMDKAGCPEKAATWRRRARNG